jgi:hypothetical protein
VVGLIETDICSSVLFQGYPFCLENMFNQTQHDSSQTEGSSNVLYFLDESGPVWLVVSNVFYVQLLRTSKSKAHEDGTNPSIIQHLGILQ